PASRRAIGGDREKEAAPSPELALQPDAATVKLNEAARNGQAESRAVMTSRRRGIHLSELHEAQGVILRGDADARIADLEANRGTSLLLARNGLHPHPTARGGEGNRVPDQVGENVRQLLAV